MDRARLRQKVLLDLLSAPWTLLPAVGGLSLLLLAGAGSRGAEYLILGGIGGLLAGVGSLLTRWILRGDAITKKAFEALQAEGFRKEEDALNELGRRLQRDDDPRTEEHLRELRALYTRFRSNAGWSTQLGQRSALAIAGQVESLFKGCLQSLERSLEFWDTAQKMATREARATVLDARERLLGEIRMSIQQLARTIDEVQALAVKRKEEQDLARIRRELDESLVVARRVEERMQALDAELGGAVTRAERE
jgi:hypothetical protein